MRVHLEHDPTANPPSEANIEMLRRKKNTVDIERRGRTVLPFYEE